MKNCNKAPGTLLTLFLSACSTVSYQEPQTGPRARVRFVTNTDAVSIVRSYDDPGCKNNETELMRLRVGPLITYKPKKLDLPLWDFHENAAKEVYIDTNKSTHFLFSGEKSIVQPPVSKTFKCAVSFSFPFEANKDYEVVLNWQPQQCRVVVNELKGKDNSAARVKLATIGNDITEERRGCLEPFKKARWY